MLGDPLARLRARYLDALLGGSSRTAIALVADAVRGGTPAEDIYLHVFQPALHEVGERHTGAALVCGTAGERHRLGARMVADFLEAAGWRVVHQAASARVEELTALARAERVDVVALSTSLPWLLPQARRMCVAMHALLDPPRVIVGGRAYVADPHVAELVGADGFAPDPAALLAQPAPRRSA